MIELKNVTKSFGGAVAVDDLSFKIDACEVVGFLGPNGAGKTTTMRMITGFMFPDRGEITLEGFDVREHEIEIKRRIGYLPENNPLYRHMLVSEYLEFVGWLRDIRGENLAHATRYAIDAAGISKVFHRPINELSKGFKQRVGLAATLLPKPDILILDEPQEGLDPNQRAEIRTLLKQLGRDHTIIISTHVLQEAAAVCTRLLIINKGKLVADGATQELAKRSATGQILKLELEGDGVKDKVGSLQGMESLTVLESKGKRVSLRVAVAKDTDLRPEISYLINQHDWTVWRLEPEESTLEEIFQQLTTD